MSLPLPKNDVALVQLRLPSKPPIPLDDAEPSEPPELPELPEELLEKPSELPEGPRDTPAPLLLRNVACASLQAAPDFLKQDNLNLEGHLSSKSREKEQQLEQLGPSSPDPSTRSPSEHGQSSILEVTAAVSGDVCDEKTAGSTSPDPSTRPSSENGQSSSLEITGAASSAVSEELMGNRRPRLLALHGRASNSQVSRMQIANLGLEGLFEVEFLDAPLSCEPDDAEDMFGIPGPFFNWLPQEPSLDDINKCVDSIADKALQADFIFGFSQGAALGLLVAKQLETRGCHTPACLCVCPAGIRLLEMLQVTSLSADSLFCMGIHDPFKAESERMLVFLPGKATSLYMNAGHGVVKAVAEDIALHSHFHEWFAQVRPQANIAGAVKLPLATSFAVADVDGGELRRASLQSQPDDASKLVQWTKAHSWFDTDASSIMDLLTRQPHDRIAIWDGNNEAFTPATYGELQNFIRGDGNLYKFGIRVGDLVSYVVEEGPMSAVMFVVVASQCNAAPLGANTTTEDMHNAFVQLSARLVIASQTLEERVQEAVDSAQTDGCCNLGLQLVNPKNTFAGCFSFYGVDPSLDNLQLQALDGMLATNLVLRTSGTTSKPKVVPLSMQSVVANGCGIAKSLGLICQDTCINAMPLFHIGGLSASVMATLSSGSSVICMPGFQPESFIQMLRRSPHPQPTWYSAVPTIHLAVLQHAQQSEGKVPHSLRFIRSGAAALSSQSAEDLRQFWGCPVLPTYSMTEQMPISQPPRTYDLSRPGSVGVPMVVVAIVDQCLRPVPVCPAHEDQKNFTGEICISGPTVMQGYADNDDANLNSFFYIAGEKYFRTGDVGYLDPDGYLHLTGREKELIKVGGEQVSPFVIEDVLYCHGAVQQALAFGVPNELFGEAVAAAVVVKEGVTDSEKDSMVAELRQLFVKKGFPPNQIPRVNLVVEEDFARTPSRKISRKETRNRLLKSFPDMSAPQQRVGGTGNASAGTLDDATLGIRFFLSLIVCLNHIGDHAWPFEGSAKPWSSAVTSMRTIGDIGVVCFGMLAGIMIAVSVKEPIKSGGYMKFFESRLVPIHLTYLIATLFCSINRIFMCQPSSFQPYTYGGLEVCRATALQWSWSGTWSASLLLTILCLQAWPVGLFVWHISYYTWFSSAYQFCIFCFPFIHRVLQRATQGGFRRVCISHVAVHVLHYLTLVFMEATYLSVRFKNPEFANYFIYAGYMFPPFWAVRFAAGVLLGLTFLKYHALPAQKASARHWAVITDGLTFLLFVTYVLLIAFQVESKHRISTVSLLEDRMYCGVIPRLMTPILSVWLYGLAVGRGFTAWICRNRFVVSVLSPASYSIYLFHQPIFEWYSITIKGEWWGQRKPGFEWFSPDPIELGSLETLVVIVLTVVFSIVVTHLTNTFLMGRWLSFVRWITCRRRANHDNDAAQLVLGAIEDLTGVRAEAADRLQDTGLASLGIAALVSTLNTSTTMKLTAADLIGCETVDDVVLAVGRKQASTKSVEDQV